MRKKALKTLLKEHGVPPKLTRNGYASSLAEKMQVGDQQEVESEAWAQNIQRYWARRGGKVAIRKTFYQEGGIFIWRVWRLK